MQPNVIHLCILGVAIASLFACSNPAQETSQKPIEQGQEAIEKSRAVQQTIGNTKSTLEQEEKAIEGSQKSP